MKNEKLPYTESRKRTKSCDTVREALERLRATWNWQWLTRTGSDGHSSFSRTVGPPVVHLMVISSTVKGLQQSLLALAGSSTFRVTLCFTFLTSDLIVYVFSFCLAQDVFWRPFSSTRSTSIHRVFSNCLSYFGGSYMKIQRLATTFGYRVAILTLENMTQFVTHNSLEDR